MKSKLLFLCVILFASTLVCAQATLTTTTLSAPVNGALPNSGTVASIQNYVILGSLTNVNGITSGLNTAIRTVLYVDKEEMAVQTVQTSTNTVNVLRGYNGTQLSAHTSGATVFVGSPDQFYQFDPIGACAVGNTKVTPWINILNGNQWTCKNAVWTLTGGPYFTGASVSVNAQGSGVSAYTAALVDAGNLVTMSSASASTFTVPPNSSVAFPVGTTLTIIQLGTGQITLTPGAGVTINNPSSLTTRTQYSTISVMQVAPNVWIAGGDLT